ncbi:hypothetical protein C9374_012272 [Naegleria lovaniensis]|uniref:Uncharacterized protein n=1 Tax=Naegleria lovaniensis TaxID=51637 RepID=A0AA88GD61_NAELO|nr:uncharacterized protein C9374_012272 [Naegleria lovaniensis]KAG2373283.1 hypothetical protein C9374_012272 [Naegleria lovaniensis]
MTSIKISCSSLCVEENYDHDGHDALIVFDSFCLTIQKFNLQQVLEWSSTCNENLPPHIWQIDESGGKMAIFENELLVDQFFRQEIDIYNLNNGTLITSISIENHFLYTSVCTCTAMAINEYTRELIICETYYTAGRIEGPYKKLQFFRKDLHNKWKHVKTVDKRAKFHCEEPLCMIWDRTAKHLLFGNWHSIFAFSLDGELVSTISPQGFQGSSRCFGCHSMALNDETGELVVLGNQWVLIFQ